MGLPSHKLRATLLFAGFLFLLFTQDLPITHAAENLLRNHGFENVTNEIPDDWIPKHSTTLFQATTSAAQEGTRSAILSKVAESKGWTYVYQDVIATPSVSYRLSGWVWWNDEKISKTSLRIDWLDEAEKRIGSKAKEVVAKLKQSAFQLLTLDETAPEETALARVEFFVNLSATNPVSPALFDNLWFGEFVGEDNRTVVINFTIPETVTAGEGFEINVSLQNLDSQTAYQIKFLAAPVGEKFYEGRTLAVDGSKYLAWNAAWDQLPKFTTDIEGNAAGNLQVLINDDAPAGEYETKIRIRHSGTEEITDSEIQNLKVEAAEPSETAEDSDEIFEGTLDEIKKLELGRKIKSCGFITAPLDIFGDDIFYIRDDSAGIKIRLSNNNYSDFHLGDEIGLGCTIEEAHDEFYIKIEGDSEVAVLRTDLDAPEPTTATTGEIGETWEGQLVKLTGELVETSGATFWIDDGSGRAKIYVKDSTGIEIPTKRVGYSATVIGIVSQWDFLKSGEPNYRVMPRFQEDLEIVLPDGESDGTDDVLGISSLPVTGSAQSEASLGLALICLGFAGKLLTKKDRRTFVRRPYIS